MQRRKRKEKKSSIRERLSKSQKLRGKKFNSSEEIGKKTTEQENIRRISLVNKIKKIETYNGTAGKLATEERQLNHKTNFKQVHGNDEFQIL